MKKILIVFVVSFLFRHSFAQENQLTYVHLSDTHIGSSTGAEDLRRTVHDINNNDAIQFVIITGDITEFGADEEIKLAKQILDSLSKPWHIIPGNHDGNWSESGANTFKKVFGNETFAFNAGGYLFLGTHSGPNMRMSPGQIPRENIVWLDSVIKATPESIPIIFANHYPLDSSLNNWFEAIDILKTKNIQLIMCGHLHSNRILNFEGIPAIVGRSNLRAKNTEGGYNIVTIKDNTVTYTERNPVTQEQKQWAQIPLINHHFKNDTTQYYRPSYAINNTYSNVKTKWQFVDNSDIGSGVGISKKLVIATNTGGLIYALNKKTGKKAWSFQTGGKIYSTPAIENNLVVVASTDNNIYCFNVSNGKLVWKFETQKPIVANAAIKNNTVYIGSSDGHFRAIGLQTGKLKWDFDSVKNFVVTTPLIYGGLIYFGSWGNEFYALDTASGELAWKWNNGQSNRMLSSAACYPVATNGRIFMVAPDRYMTVLDAQTGEEIWRKKDNAYRVRESMGLSKDSAIVYAKTMDGFVIGVSTDADEMEIPWISNTQLNYEIAPTAIVEMDNVVYVPSNSGVVTAVNRADGAVIWKHKISNALVTNISAIAKNKIIVTNMDGKVTCLEYQP